MVQMNYTYFVNHLKLNIARHNFSFDVCVNTKVLRFVNILYKLRVIRRFMQITPKKYRIYTAWIGRHPNALTLKCYSRGLNPICIRYKSLLILQHNVFNSHIILDTSRGLMTHQEAIKAKVGGFLVCIIN